MKGFAFVGCQLTTIWLIKKKKILNVWVSAITNLLWCKTSCHHWEQVPYAWQASPCQPIQGLSICQTCRETKYNFSKIKIFIYRTNELAGTFPKTTRGDEDEFMTHVTFMFIAVWCCQCCRGGNATGSSPSVCLVPVHSHSRAVALFCSPPLPTSYV